MSEPKWVTAFWDNDMETVIEIVKQDKSICKYIHRMRGYNETLLAMTIIAFTNNMRDDTLCTLFDVVLSSTDDVNVICCEDVSEEELITYTPMQLLMEGGYHYDVFERLVYQLVRRGARIDSSRREYGQEYVTIYNKLVTRRNQLLTTCALVLTSKILSKDMSELLVKIILEK